MDFQQLMSLASQNQMRAEKKLPATKKYSTQVSAPKKLQKVRVESETLKKLRKEKDKEKFHKEQNEINDHVNERIKEQKRREDALRDKDKMSINDHITERIKEQKRREDALRDKKMSKVKSKVLTDTERGKVRNEKQIERAKERRENINERNLTPKMREKLQEERLREKLREIKLKNKQAEKKEGFKIPKGSSDGPKSSNDKSARISTSISSAGIRPLYKIVPKEPENSTKSAPKKAAAKAPPPMDFNSLMKIASQKASDSRANMSNTAAKNPLGRPMTQEEKERHQRMTSKQFKEWYKYGTSPPRSESPTEDIKKDSKSAGDKVRKKETIDSSRKDKRPSESSEKKRPDSMNGDPKKKSSSSDTKNSSKSKNGGGDDLADKYKQLEMKYKALEEQMKKQASYNEKKVQKSSSQKLSSSSSSVSQKSSSSSSNNSKNKQMSSKSGGKYATENDNLLVCRPAEKEPDKPMSAWDRIYNQIQKTDPKKPVKRKRVIDSSEEEEEEMADFIDDEPLEDEYSSNYSKCIREIFGYDRRKFRFDDEDDDNMETSYAQQMKEEIRSTKIGILEDLEDIRLEKEQNKKKKGKLK